MDNTRRFYKCNICQNIAALVELGGVPLDCCGQPMEEIIPNTVDASREKHVPVIRRNGREIIVEVGSVPHPMEEKHHINWIAIGAGAITVRKQLVVGEPAILKVTLDDDKPVAAYAMCNIHGLWKAEET